MTHELIRQVRLIDPVGQTDRVADVLLADGCIQAIAPTLTNYPDQTEIHEGSGCVLGPGLVDLYSTVGEPGFESRETLQSIAEAAVAGGFTRISLLPDTHPAVDSPEQVAWMLAHGPRHLPLKLQYWGALTQQGEGQHLVELSELATAGICGFSDGQPLANWMLTRRALEYLAPLQKPIALWPCHRSLAGQGVIREGLQALQTGLPEAPVIAETTALAGLLEVVDRLKTPIHIMRVSTARSVALLAMAKDRGLPITASVSWMHLLWNSEHLRSYDVNLRLDPPLGNPADQDALIEGLATGVIDAIAVDHRPYTYEEKTVPFADAPPGAIGLELAFPLLWQAFVQTQRWSVLDLWSKLSVNPRRIFGESSLPMTEGQATELMLFDPQQAWRVTRPLLKSLSANTPYWETLVMGRTLKTWLGC